ncbi:SLOG family protein [Streptomyces griseoflavus]|uniref:SLOG family protein n=1 Tax=Streptomyces griseoflavus TaxID=35619 RepID=UPI00339DDDB0
MVKPYRVLVTGSRTWEQPNSVWTALNDARGEALQTGRPFVVVHGACPRGADAHAARWCATATQFADGVTEEPHPADWQTNGKRAGFIRNAHMVNLGADVVLAFIRDGSRGASHTAALAERAGIPVRHFTT